MDKRAVSGQRWYMGIDVSARELTVAWGNGTEAMKLECYANTAAGHHHLLRHFRALAAPVQVCLEASGNYTLDIALALARAGGAIQVSLANPRRVRRFAESLGQRSKTDPVDARALCQ